MIHQQFSKARTETAKQYEGRYCYFFKIEDANPATREKEKGGIRVRMARSTRGPWSPPTTEMLPGNLPNSEGPSPVALPDGSVIVYYDKTGALMAAQSYDENLEIWEDVSDQLTQPLGFRHGTVRALKPVKSSAHHNPTPQGPSPVQNLTE